MPVGPGLVLHTLSAVPEVPGVELKTVKRYGGAIAAAAADIRAGRWPTLTDDETADVAFLPCAPGLIGETVTDPQAVIATIRATYGDRPGVTLDELDGLTVAGSAEAGPWWFNVRPSNTEPLLRLNVEAADAEQMSAIRDDVLAMMRSGR